MTSACRQFTKAIQWHFRQWMQFLKLKHKYNIISFVGYRKLKIFKHVVPTYMYRVYLMFCIFSFLVCNKEIFILFVILIINR